MTPIHGRSHVAVFGPALTPGSWPLECGDSSPLFIAFIPCTARSDTFFRETKNVAFLTV
jgi:hypothetical protein